jgi:hypothetical protein
MSKPLIGIDDLVREMTDEEYANYLTLIAESPQLAQDTNETPSPA